MSKEFIIGNKTYNVKKFCLRQWEMLLQSLVDVDFSSILTVQDIVRALSNKLSRLMAIGLVEKGTDFDWKNLANTEEFMGCNLDIDIALEVVKDFLEITPVSQIREKVTALFSTSPSKIESKT